MASSDAKRPIPYSRRAIKAVPLPQDRNATSERRRDLFLRKVQQDREEKRWEARGDQIMKLDFVSERKRWEAEQARAAPNLDEPPEDSGNNEVDDYSAVFRNQQIDAGQSSQAEEEAEAVMQQENEELEALITMMEEQDQPEHNPSIVSPSLGSDDEEYDSIFSEYISAQSATQLPSPDSAFHRPDADAMDTTNG